MLTIGTLTLVAGIVNIIQDGVNFNNSILLVIAACCLSTYFLKRKSWKGNSLESDKPENL